MSWSIQYIAKDKASALAEVDKPKGICEWVPVGVKGIIKDAISTQQDPPDGYGFMIQSSGHIQDTPCTYGSCVVSVNMVRVV